MCVYVCVCVCCAMRQIERWLPGVHVCVVIV